MARRVLDAAAMRVTMIALMMVVAGCGSSGSGPQNGDGFMSQQPVAVCQDQNGMPITCPMPVTADLCTRGDATACTVVTRTELSVGAKTCLRVVLDNRCSAEAYSNTCIEYKQGDGKLEWQCWVSSTLVGDTIDVAQCDATGRWYHVASISPGELDVIDQQGSCPKPM
jgi:hypothetical protein